MVLDDPADQLHQDLTASIHSALKPRRPVIHHLNDDSSWLLQIPRPENAIRRGSRIYFNIVIDPWFKGGQTDLAKWFSQQYHATPSAVQSFAELEDLIRGVEKLASAEVRLSGGVSDNVLQADTVENLSLVDAIAVSHEFTDHCHHDTLIEAHKDVPVFAFKEAAALIQSWGHFRTVIPIGSIRADEEFDWRTSSLHPFLPEWLGICQLRQSEDRFNLHSALLITFNSGHVRSQLKLKSVSGEHDTSDARRRGTALHEDDESAEALVYTPHGVHSADFEVLAKAVPSISTLVLLHGLHDVRVGGMQLNLGASNGLKAQRVLQAKHWFNTHDEASFTSRRRFRSIFG